MKKKYIVIALIVVAAAVGGYFMFREKTPAVQTYEVTKRDFVQTVSATGELKANTEINLNFETVGRIKEIKTFVGQNVAQGDFLAALEDKVLSGELANAKAALDKAKAQAGISDDEIERLKGLVDEAEDTLSDTKKLEKQKVDAAEDEVAQAQDAYNDNVDYYNRVALESGVDSSAAKFAKISVTNAKNTLDSAEINEKTVKKSKDLAITQAESSVAAAKDNLEKAKSDHQEDFDDATVAAAQAQYLVAQGNLEKSSLKAPVNGKVTKVNFKRGEIISSALTTPFAKLLSSDLLVEANVAESDIAKVKVGDKAVLTYDSLGDDEKFEAEVLSVDPDATVVQEVTYYLVKFRLRGNLDSRLKPGMTANIDIETSRKDNVVAIPERLVKEENGTRYVEILDANNQKQRRDIKLGTRGDEGLVEVVSGLKEGEKVVQ